MTLAPDAERLAMDLPLPVLVALVRSQPGIEPRSPAREAKSQLQRSSLVIISIELI